MAACYADIVAGFDLYELVSLQALTSVTGSLVIALAVFKQELDADRAWGVSQIDETYRMSRCGDDPEAADSRAIRREDLNAAVRLLELNRALKPVIG
jgi:chaperone required for assembly of F1-ATPase